MKLVYTGIFDEVLVPEWVNENGYPQSAKRGEEVEVDDKLARRLLDQHDNWAKAPVAAQRNTRPVAADSAAAEE